MQTHTHIYVCVRGSQSTYVHGLVLSRCTVHVCAKVVTNTSLSTQVSSKAKAQSLANTRIP